MNFKKIITKLSEKKMTISTMESCTGGGVANAITNCEGASEVLKFSAVTYSNEYKIKMGVSENVINQYSVYSMECADEMSFNISKFANSDIGVGITGKINKADINNPYGDDNIVFISIYDKNRDLFIRNKIKMTENTRKLNKDLIIREIVDLLNILLKD